MKIDRIDHFVRLREQQDKTGGFQCFIPLAFYPPGTALSQLPGPDAIDNLKTIAVSRLMLDNFDHIKAYWVMLGKATAQTALEPWPEPEVQIEPLAGVNQIGQDRNLHRR